jgi:NADPH:quinone reductase
MVGTVEAEGRSVRGFPLDARVWCNNQGYDGRQGAFAEYLAVDEDLLYRLPDGADEKEAVAVAHSALTAYTGLVREARLRTGEAVFINGGSGNVGSATLQFAHNIGARVLVTAGSADRIQQYLELGANRAINYKNKVLLLSSRALGSVMDPG